MGSNLARNMASKGFVVSCYDWDEALRQNFAANYTDGFVHAGDLKEFVESIEEGRPPSPSVAECVQSVKLAAMIQAGRSGQL